MIEIERASWPRKAEESRRDYLQRRFTDWIVSEHIKPHYTLAGRLLDELTKEAVKSVDDADYDKELHLQQKLVDADSLVTELMHAAMSHEQEYAKREQPDFWRHAIEPFYEIKNKTYKVMVKASVEGAADFYLQQPLRHALFDRTLVDMLLALELYQYADEMIHPMSVPGLPPRSPLKQPHPLWSLVQGIALVTVLLGGAAWFVSTAMSSILGNSVGWIIFACGALWTLCVAWSFVALPSVWTRHFAARRKALALLDAMLTTYAQMKSDSVISAQHILNSANQSAAQGVVWPSPLFVLLEDVIRRGGRL